MDNNELKRLILEGSNKTYDQISTNKNRYSFLYLEKIFKKILNINSLNTDILKTLELIDNDKYLTNAGDLLADINEYNIIDIVRFGEDKDTILSRFQLKNMSILQAFDFCFQKYKEYYQYEIIEKAYRQNIEEIPEKAFREAIANALVHRNWMSNSYIQVSMRKNSISITSPGGLPSNLTRDEYLNGQISVMQNPVIGNVFFRLNIIESFGTGIKRIKNSYINARNKPEFHIFENSIKVILPEIELQLPLSIDQEKVFLAIQNNTLSSSQIANMVGFGKNKVLKILNELIEMSYAVKIGRGRGTKYESKI